MELIESAIWVSAGFFPTLIALETLDSIKTRKPLYGTSALIKGIGQKEEVLA
jgi:hypothetical protein